MAKSNTYFECEKCGHKSPKWLGKCPSCEEWNTFNEQAAIPEKKQTVKKSFRIPPLSVTRIVADKTKRFQSGFAELDTVLGGGIVPASMVLIGGDPGIGKSTLLTQVSATVAKSQKVLYVSAEESGYQVKMRCERLSALSENLFVLCETNVDDILCAMEEGDYPLVIIDSVQAVYTPEIAATAGSVSQIKECAKRLTAAAKASGAAVFLVGHVTKEGSIAGPKVLEHIMDTVLYFEGDLSSSFKILRAVKNRFGSTNEIGIFEMHENGICGVSNPSAVLLSENRGKSAGAVAMPSVEGSRCILVEIQALTAQTVFGIPRRMAVGMDYNKLSLLLAVMEKRASLLLSDKDVYLSVMGGMRLVEPSSDLAVICAVCSALKNIAIDKNTAVFGEVGLTGEVRAVSQAEKRVSECIKLGFSKVILPKANLKDVQKFTGSIQLVPVNHVYPCVKALFAEEK